MSICGSKRHSSLPVAASNAYARPATPLVYITPSITTGVASSTRFVPRSALQARPSASTFATVMPASCEWCDLPGLPPVVGQSSALGREAVSACEAEPDGSGTQALSRSESAVTANLIALPGARHVVGNGDEVGFY